MERIYACGIWSASARASRIVTGRVRAGGGGSMASSDNGSSTWTYAQTDANARIMADVTTAFFALISHVADIPSATHRRHG